MKKLIIISIIILSVAACKKTKYEPEGPTAVRVKNSSDVPFTEVRVNISDSIKLMGNISAGGYCDYVRFHKAFAKAEISAKVSGQLFSTGIVDYTGLTYLGQVKMTYEVWISDFTNKKLEIRVVYPLDGPLE
ncbi:MAG TPA: hypothetical protein VIK07_12040 [Bacteroidales bacterium]